MEKISLRAVRKHSALKRIVRVYESFDLILRPWTPEQLEIAMPIAVRLIEEAKKYEILNFRGKPIEELLLALVPVFKQSKDYFDSVIDLVYISLESTNETIEIELDGKKEIIPFFEKEEIRKQLELPVIIRVLAILLELNFTENPFLSSTREKAKTPHPNLTPIE